MPDRLRIGFVTIHAADDESAYSGTAFAMRAAFRANQDVELIDIDRLITPLYPLWRAKQAAYWLVAGKRYWMNRQPAVVASYGSQVNHRVTSAGPVDVLLSPGSIPLAFYDGPIPTAFWSDATFDRLAEFYPEASNFAMETVVHGHRLERDALTHCALAIYSSEWARQSAEATYHTPPAKLATVSYGANIIPATGPTDAEACITRRSCRPWRLLFIGSHWLRKGGDLAVAIAAELIRRGHHVVLDVVGCKPPTPVPAFVTVHGFLDKRSPTARRLLDSLFRDSHILVLPTRADCVPMVIAEAFAYGLPTAATDVGGVSSVVEDGVNGRLLPLAADVATWCTALEGMLLSPDRYRDLASTAVKTFRASLNWPVAVAKVVNLLRSHCAALHAA